MSTGVTAMRHLTIGRAWRLVPLAALLTGTLGGCVSSMGPISWETGYRQIEEVSPDDPDALRWAILPNTCRAGFDERGVIPLPPGCANDLNLQWMVERPEDLLRGREMGPARAGPVGAAARELLEDRERPRDRRLRLEAESQRSYGASVTTGDL